MIKRQKGKEENRIAQSFFLLQFNKRYPHETSDNRHQMMTTSTAKYGRLGYTNSKGGRCMYRNRVIERVCMFVTSREIVTTCHRERLDVY